MHEIKIIAFLGVISVLCNSCIDSRLIYIKNGICISGERPFPKSLTFIPLKWTSASHIYDSIYIDYQRPFDANLENIYICLFGREINLASFSYNEIAQMDMGKSWVKKHCLLFKLEERKYLYDRNDIYGKRKNAF